MKKRTFVSFIILIALSLPFTYGGCGGGGGSDSGDDGGDRTSQDIVKDVYVNVGGSDSIVMTAVDANDRYYTFYGVKDEENLLINFDRLVVDQLKASDELENYLTIDKESDELEHYLTIDFDEYQRPIGYTLPDSGDQIIFDYISDSIVEVTYQPVVGASEMVVVDNLLPFPDQIPSSSVVYNSSMLSLSFDDQWNYQGNITTCRDGKIPKITIKRELNATIKEKFPALRLIFSQNAQKMSIAPPGEPDYFYYFSVIIMDGFYENWKPKCIAQCNKIGFLDYGEGKIGGLIKKTKDNDILMELAKKNAAATGRLKPTIKDIQGRMTLGIPIVDFINGVKDVWSGKQTCSVKNYNIYREIVKNKLTISCTYNGATEKSEYMPGPPHDEGNWEVDPKLDFDFSDKCQKGSLWPTFPNPEYCSMKGAGFPYAEIDGVLNDGTYAECGYYDNGQLSLEWPWIDYKTSGIWKYYYESGGLMAAGLKIDGLREGRWEYYGENGDLMDCYIYENNHKIGTCT